MALSFRSILLHTTGAAALFAAGSAAAQTVPTTVISGGGSTLATPSYEAAFKDSLLTPPYIFSYTSSGSGPAQAAFIANSIPGFGGATPFTTGTIPSSTTSDLPNVDFAASDAALSSLQIASFSTLYGYPIIQLATMGTPITIPFNIAGATTNGSITLTNDDVCGIFSGSITNWSGVSTHPTTAAIEVAYRCDGSGTSFLLTQHLAATCTTGNSAFTLPIAASTTFSSVFTAHGGTVPGNFTAVSGSPGIQAAVLATAGTTGYVSPDFTQIASANNGNAAFPVVAAVGVSAATAVLPDLPDVSLALSQAVIPNEPGNSTGAPTVPADPTHWVPAVTAPTAGYPIVGYTNWYLASCYTDGNVVTGLTSFLQNWYDITKTTVAKDIHNHGFITVPSALSSAVNTTFLTGGGALAVRSCTPIIPRR